MNNVTIYPFGFGLNWNFYQEEDATAIQVLKDLKTILSICQKHDLLVPRYYLDGESNRHSVDNTSYELLLEDLLNRVNKNEITGEIARIGGEGWVFLSSGKKEKQTDLITIDSIRLFERNITIQTRINCWTPLAMDDDYNFHWQVELSLANEDRLERCLREIQQSLGAEVEPSEDEIDNEQPVWQKGFRLYWNPEVLQREFTLSQPKEKISLEKYLLNPDDA